MYCNVCNKYRKFKETKISYNFKKTLNISIIYSKSGHEYKIIIKEEKWIEILKILGLINNIEEYQKICNHAWKNVNTIIIQTEKCRWNKKSFNWRNKSK